jgi:hypothetical protein
MLHVGVDLLTSWCQAMRTVVAPRLLTFSAEEDVACQQKRTASETARRNRYPDKRIN